VASMERLAGLIKDEITALANTDIRTVTDLWEWVGRDPDLGIDLLSKECGLTKERLIEILKLQGLLETRHRGGSWISRNWLELVLLFGLALIVGLFLFSRSRGELAGLPAPLGQSEPLQVQVVVSAPGGLPTFHQIGTGDLTLALRPSQPDSFLEVGDVVGRFTLQAIPAEATLLANQLSAPIEGSASMRILSLPVASHQLAIIQAGKPAFLWLSPNQPGEGTGSFTGPIEVIVLADSIDGETGSIVVAVKEVDLTALANGLGYSDVIVTSSGE
jgi:hypothetical protein